MYYCVECRYQPWELCMLYRNKSLIQMDKYTVDACINEQITLQEGSLSRIHKHREAAKLRLIGEGRFICKLGHIYHE